MSKEDDAEEKARDILKKALEQPLPAGLFLEILVTLERLAPPVSEQPDVTLSHWCVRRTDLQGKLEDFLLGIIVGIGVPRKSSPVRSFDPGSRVVVTRSGRVYRLEGEPHPDADYIDPWDYAFGKQPFENVTQIYVDQMRKASN